jgi:hypothetical protein
LKEAAKVLIGCSYTDKREKRKENGRMGEIGQHIVRSLSNLNFNRNRRGRRCRSEEEGASPTGGHTCPNDILWS